MEGEAREPRSRPHASFARLTRVPEEASPLSAANSLSLQAVEPSAEAKENVSILQGPRALTDFEAVRLLSRLQQLRPAITAVDAAFLYLLKSREPAPSSQPAQKQNNSRLRDLLGPAHDLAPGPRLWITPRTGTQSPLVLQGH